MSEETELAFDTASGDIPKGALVMMSRPFMRIIGPRVSIVVSATSTALYVRHTWWREQWFQIGTPALIWWAVLVIWLDKYKDGIAGA